MANKVVFEVVATSKGFEVVQSHQKKLKKDIEGTAGSHKKLNKAQDNTNKKEKALFQSNLSASKGFSKMKETMGQGSSGLVGAYATLAANVFAATAAFNALRSAAQVDTLIEGFTFLGNQAGKSSLQIAEGIRQTTDNAISLETALRSASIAVTSGFRTDQIAQLTEVARNASIALGRNMTDSIDRLFRGVAKLEPEILDELGILVRLDTAVTEYAASLNKSATQLTDAERRQAFLNATIEQGTKKYGALSDAVKPNQFDQLSAAFEELTRKGLKLINTVFAPFLSIIAGSSSAMIGGLVLFGSTILTTMIPALGNMAEKQTQVANSAKFMAAEAANAGKQAAQTAKIDLVRGSKAKTKSGAEFSAVNALQKKLKSNTAETKDFEKAQRQVNATMNRQKEIAKRNKTLNTKAHKDRMNELRALKQQIKDTQNAERGRSSTRGSSAFLASKADAASGLAGEEGALALIGGAGVKDGFKIANKEFGNFKGKIDKGFKESQKLTKGYFKGFGLSAMRGFTLAGAGAKLFGAALLNAIPIIGQVLFFGGLLIGFLKNLFTNSSKSSERLKNLADTVDTAKEKLEQLKNTNAGVEKSLIKAGVSYTDATIKTIEQGNALQVTSGILEEFGSNMNLFLRQVASGEDEIGVFSGIVGKLGDKFDAAGEKIGEFFSKIMTKLQPIMDFFREFGSMIAAMFGLDQATLQIEKAAREVEDQMEQLIKNTAGTDVGKTIAETLKDFDPAKRLEELTTGVNALTVPQAIKQLNVEYVKLTSNITNSADAAKNLGKSMSEFQKVFSKNKKSLLQENTFDELAKSFEEVIKKVNTLKAGGQFTELEEFVKNEVGTETLQQYGLEVKHLTENYEEGKGPADLFLQSLKDAAELTRTNKLEVKQLNAELNALKSSQKLTEAAEEFRLSSENFALRGKFEVSEGDRIKASLEKQQRLIENEMEAAGIKEKLIDKEFELELLKLEIFGASTDQLEKVEAVINGIKDIRKEQLGDETTTNLMGIVSSGLRERNTAGSAGAFDERVSSAASALDSDEGNIISKVQAVRNAMTPLMDDLKSLGPEGELAANVGLGALQMAESFGVVAEAGFSSAEGLLAVGTAITSIGSILQSQAKAQVASIEQQIEIEKKRDGKSAESVAKISAMEKKKEAIQRKAFERNKKMQIAAAIANTASGVVAALGDNANGPTPLRIAMAAMIGAMGAAQIAIIQRQQFQGGGGESPQVQNTALKIGGRSNAVDTSQRATAGELSYLRGDRGVGTNANNFTGAAMGRKGYANGGESIVVGERGPEVITPTSPVDITPNFALGGQAQNINFNISAVDGASVQNMLNEQQGNIIAMIRQAANDNGEGFLETVDPTVYGGGG